MLIFQGVIVQFNCFSFFSPGPIFQYTHLPPKMGENSAEVTLKLDRLPDALQEVDISDGFDRAETRNRPLLEISYCCWFRNPARKPVEIGRFSHYLQGFSTIPGGCLGFLPSTVGLVT